jgi:protein TonB
MRVTIKTLSGTSSERSPRSRPIAIGASVLTHVVAGSFGIWLSTLPRSFPGPGHARTAPRYDLVWIASPGPGGGGGGGGNQTAIAAPARQVGRDRMTVPAARAEPKPIETPKEPPPIEPVTIPAKPMAASADIAPGVVSSMPAMETTQGPGAGGGAGTGAGTGSGEGQGSGLGPGAGGGTGGGAYRPGSGVSPPQLVREIKPNYTVSAMRAKIQGVVLLECVVLPDGTIGDVKILTSLDKTFGLDEEAIKAARQWRFLPGRRFGEPVPVFVTIELMFTLR